MPRLVRKIYPSGNAIAEINPQILVTSAIDDVFSTGTKRAIAGMHLSESHSVKQTAYRAP
jgi:hypothetical protein